MKTMYIYVPSMVYVVYLLHAWDRILPVLPVPVAEVNNIETHGSPFFFESFYMHGTEIFRRCLCPLPKSTIPKHTVLLSFSNCFCGRQLLHITNTPRHKHSLQHVFRGGVHGAPLVSGAGRVRNVAQQFNEFRKIHPVVFVQFGRRSLPLRWGWLMHAWGMGHETSVAAH
jgi:hypothetical protein